MFILKRLLITYTALEKHARILSTYFLIKVYFNYHIRIPQQHLSKGVLT